MTKPRKIRGANRPRQILLQGFSQDLVEKLRVLAGQSCELNFHTQPQTGVEYDVTLTNASDAKVAVGTISATVFDPGLQALHRLVNAPGEDKPDAREALTRRCSERLLAVAEALSRKTAAPQYVDSIDTTAVAPAHTLEESLNDCIARRRGDSEPLGLILVSIDNIINLRGGACSAKAQAQCLDIIEQRITRLLDTHDTTIRTASRQFAVILRPLHTPSPLHARAPKLMEALRHLVTVDSAPLQIIASIGLAKYLADSDSASTLIRHSSTALHRAHERGGNCFEYFNTAQEARLSKRWMLEEKLRRALDQQQFTLEYHPMVTPHDGRIAGVESLLRWDDPERGRIVPERFIPALEETAMIIPVGEWLLYESCCQIGQWQEEQHETLNLSVNVSPKQLDDPEFVRKLSRILKLSGIEPGRLHLELTENLLLGNSPEIVDTLNGIGALGVQLSIDDFGTGFSSLSYLKRLPLRGIKIDKSFIQDIPDNANNTAITLSILELGRSMNLQVVTEGVETAAQAAFLAKHGADLLQGFYFSKPLPAAHIAQLLESRASLPAQSPPLSLGAAARARDH